MTTLQILIKTLQTGTRQGQTRLLAGLSGNINIATDIEAIDLINPAKSLSLVMEKSPDGNDPWTFEASFTWTGGPLGRNGQPPVSPSMGGPVSIPPGWWIRITLTVSGPITIGASVTF